MSDKLDPVNAFSTEGRRRFSTVEQEQRIQYLETVVSVLQRALGWEIIQFLSGSAPTTLFLRTAPAQHVSTNLTPEEREILEKGSDPLPGQSVGKENFTTGWLTQTR